MKPTLRFERSLLREGRTHLACLDEVGRGALSGPVSIGAVLISLETRTAPQGVRDSKLLTPAARLRLVPRIQRWALAYGVGHASSDEIDEFGIMAALRLAGHRALGMLGTVPDLVLLDGNHDYLTPPEQLSLLPEPGAAAEMPPVLTRIKADMRCAAVAAASILAKTERDALMVGLDAVYPGYGWAENKGYSAPEHLSALAQRGPCREHRVSWRLPGVDLDSRLTAAVKEAP
ncbi:ribonuclease HII [Nocardioides sp. Bht2]|uniref:ribonuclease HII n=1 Tax=Nocardioides sp. Bht2 TaxID=3392297 RepID=UPI0039B49670